MKNFIQFITVSCIVCLFIACDKSGSQNNADGSKNTGLKIAYVNGDTILLNYREFRAQSESMDAKQKEAEDMLQSKGAALEKEYNDYQQKAKTGTMTGKEMEAHEKYLTSKQQDLMAERDRLAKEISDESSQINDRLQKAMQDKLEAIKKRDGYDFIFSYIHGGSILLADPKYDITAEVLKELNKSSGEKPATDTSAKK